MPNKCENSRQVVWMLKKRHCELSHADAKGALLCFEGLARLTEFLGAAEAARAVFAAGERRGPPTSRFLREWALFEKRQGDLDVRFSILF